MKEEDVALRERLRELVNDPTIDGRELRKRLKDLLRKKKGRGEENG